MKKLLFFYTTLITCVGLLCFFAASVYLNHINNLNLAKDTVKEIAQICADLYTINTDISAFAKAGNDTRITVIAADGRVLADSRPLDFAALENHLERPEIQAAAMDDSRAFIRHSTTLGVDFIYYALKVVNNDNYVFIRAAIPVTRIDAYLFSSLPLLILSLLFVALLCFFFMHNLANRIVKPFSSLEQKLRLLANGEYSNEPIKGGYTEIGVITREIDEIALLLQENYSALINEKIKLSYILNNIGDGLFVVDEEKSIILINSAALDIFTVTSDIINKNLTYLTYEKNLNEAVVDCIDLGKSSLFEQRINGNIFLVSVKRLPETLYAMVILSDVTENRENTKQREEFFANASHELKTPLTAIKGFNELALINNKDTGIRKFIDSISRETERMISLLADMLRLSELENKQEINPSNVSLAKITQEVQEAVSTSIAEKSIVFEIKGEITVQAEVDHVYELVKNLVENAIRYNNPGGKVSVTMETSKEDNKLIISDNGIGISLEEQSRIFERFYRVEKSRSLRNGGTGLGLAIVKHICALYGWKLSLSSKLGLGTHITISFGTHKSSQ